MYIARGRGGKQRGRGAGKKQKQASDPLSSDPHCSEQQRRAFTGLLARDPNPVSGLVLKFHPALVQQVAAVSSLTVAVCCF